MRERRRWRRRRGQEDHDSVWQVKGVSHVHKNTHTSLTYNDSCLVCRCGGGTGTSGRGCDPSPETRGSRMGARP